MTPQERQLIDQLFERLASLEGMPRDPGAVGAINDGLERAPHGLYPLVQTVLVQDEALKRAQARIRELESELGLDPEQPARQGGFLDNMRDTLLGRRDQQGSVPSVRPGEARWGTGAPQPPGGQPWAGQQPQQPAQGGWGGGGGSFLGTAAATVAGVVGGTMLMNSMRGMFGGQQGQGQGAFEPGSQGGSPWGSESGGGDLSRQAGIEDIGRGDRTAAYDNGQGSERHGLFDTAQNDAGDDGDFDIGGDFDGDFGGSSDT